MEWFLANSAQVYSLAGQHLVLAILPMIFGVLIAVPLAQLARAVAKGNPLHMAQYLTRLNELGALSMDGKTGSWRCDLAAADALGASTSLLELLVERLDEGCGHRAGHQDSEHVLSFGRTSIQLRRSAGLRACRTAPGRRIHRGRARPAVR